MKQMSKTKFQITNAIIWAVMIVACSFIANVLKEPEMIMFVLVGGWVASTGLLGGGSKASEDS